MRRLLLLAALFTAAPPLVGGLAAQQPARPDRGAAVRAEQRAREQERDDLRADAAELRREISRLRRQLVELGADQAVEERALTGRRSRLAELNAREAQLRARMAGTRSQQARLLGALQLYQRNPPPALLVSPRSAKDAVRAAILMRAVAPELERRAAGFAAEAATITQARRQAAAAAEEVFTAESDVADRASEIERLIAGKSELERSLLLDADQAEADARRLAARAASLGDLVDLVTGDDRGTITPSPVLMDPVEGAVLRDYGDRTPAGRAKGVTYVAGRGGVVRSPVDATIQFAGTLKGHGVVLILRAAGAYDIVLSGLDSAVPPPGGRVAAGEPIGRMAEDRPAPELYLELRRNGAPVDPSRRLQTAPVRSVTPGGDLRGAIPPG
jgi:septal ring factor EnvC (AmiA/AmiB activator)